AARANAAAVDIANTLAANPSITIEGWFTMNSLQGWSKVWMFGTPNGGSEPGLSYVDFTPRRGDGSNVPSISLDTVSATEVNTSGGSNPAILSAGTEYYVAAVYNAGDDTMYFYIDGSLVDSASMNGGNVTQLQATEAWFGAAVYWGDNNLNGSINEVRIWDGPLTSDQIAEHYTLGQDTLPMPALGLSTFGSGAILSWPESYSGLQLETSPVLGAEAEWTPVTVLPTVEDGNQVITLPMTNSAGFYRLHY
ncbi:MAG: LamG domain-containing protein, partial [Pontiellaceae bacterium]|nr:LamG domain-containing protein [Pontiellaceae bacterium]